MGVVVKLTEAHNAKASLQPLAARVDQVMSKFGDKLDIGPGPVEDDVVDMSHVLLDKRDQRLKTRLRIVSFGKLDDNSHGILLNSSRASVKQAKVTIKAGQKARSI